MPTDLTTIIEQSVADANEGGDSGTAELEPGAGGVGAAGDGSGTADPAGSGAAVGAVDPPAPGAGDDPPASADPTDPAAAAAESDEVIKLLEAAGIKAPAEGQRENRIPYGRVRKIIGNALKKTTDLHTTALTEVQGKLTAAEAKTALMDRIDTLIATDPDRYLTMLAGLHPDKYGKFLHPRTDPAVVKPADPAAEVGPMPAPDVDGGYSAAGLTSLLEWTAKKAKAETLAAADARMTERFGPFEEREKAAKFQAEQLPAVKARIAAAKETWGKVYVDDHPDVLAAMKTGLTFEAACAKVFLPLVAADRNKMRLELIAEQNARPRAAAKTPPAASVAPPAATGPRDLLDVIGDAVATIR